MTQGKVVLTEQYTELVEDLKDFRKPDRPRLSWLFVVFMLALTVLCLGLGYWQVQRLEQKLALIASVEERASLPPVALPLVDEWPAFDPVVFDFRPVTIKGRFVHANTAYVFTSLSNANGSYSGPGYWVMTAFELETGGIAIVNRGFVPQDSREAIAAISEEVGDEAAIIINGIARKSARANNFTPGSDLIKKIEYVRSLDRLIEIMDLSDRRVVPVYVDQVAGAPGVLPQGGETTMVFPNRHVEYAMTWFSLAAVAFVMTLYWMWRQTKQ